MTRSTRFEKKILAALVTVAVVPLVAALWLGQGAVREAYAVGVNPRVQAALDQSLYVYRALLVSVRDDAKRTADAVAHDVRLRRALARDERAEIEGTVKTLMGESGRIARIEVVRDGDTIAEVERAALLDTSDYRTLARTQHIDERTQVVVTLAESRERFREYQRTGELVRDFAILERNRDSIAWRYVGVYTACLLLVVTTIAVITATVSRRVTRRVADLASATQQVGRGDLSVEVPTDARDEVGELTRAFNAMVRDLRDSRARIEYLQRISGWQEFARRLAHEIKNPLTPIQLAIQEVHERYAGSDEAFRQRLADARTVIEEEVETLRQLVGAFSSFAKLPETTLAPHELREFVSDLERSIPAILDDESAPHVTVAFEPTREPLPVEIDALMLRRCMDNLLRNAVHSASRAHPAGGAKVALSTRRDGSNALIEVRDNGEGIENRDRERIFDPYFTTKPEGTGLGLAIVKKVVLEHGGAITVLSNEDGGASFQIRLPLRRGEARA